MHPISLILTLMIQSKKLEQVFKDDINLQKNLFLKKQI